MEENIKLLQRWLEESRSAVFFGGAGVSTESGIPDFRSQDGLYNQHYDVPPEEILSCDFFRRDPDTFYRFYREKLMVDDAKPNVTHEKLAALEKAGHLAGIVTQNIDGLHQKAGSRQVWELHGSLFRNHCVSCGKRFSGIGHMNCAGTPRCGCGGVIRPDIVMYGEMLEDDVVQGAVDAIRNADMLIVGGTSLVVYPAAGLLRYYRGKRLVLINKSPTSYDSAADLLFTEKLGDVFSKINI
ncbi:MAG: NAD-dependent protein deacylase [Oscillospiraceae bacterium]|nr:NAD-dependent protein deacylase [Oscillospiraceae bacterium]